MSTRSRRRADLEVLLAHLGVPRHYPRGARLGRHDRHGLRQQVSPAHRSAMVRTPPYFLNPGASGCRWSLWLIRRMPLFAVPAVLGLNLFARGAARTASARGLAPAVRKGLLAPYNSWGNRRATLKFVQDIPLTPQDASFAIARQVHDGLHRLAGKPMLICWGENCSSTATTSQSGDVDSRRRRSTGSRRPATMCSKTSRGR